MAMKKVYSTKTGKVTWAQPNPARPGEYLMPADATEFPPPAFDDSSKKAKYVNNSWVTEDLTPEELHEASGSTGTFIGQLDDIGNIALDSVTNGQALIWDAENNKWTNGNVAAGEGGSNVAGSGGVIQQVVRHETSEAINNHTTSWADLWSFSIDDIKAGNQVYINLAFVNLWEGSERSEWEILNHNRDVILSYYNMISSSTTGWALNSTSMIALDENPIAGTNTYTLRAKGGEGGSPYVWFNYPSGGKPNTSEVVLMEIGESSGSAGGTVISETSPIGMIAPFAMENAPDEWLVCDGSTLNSVANPEYADLFAAIGTTWGGTGASDFKLPDLQGSFLRGIGNGSINGREKYGPSTVGEFQEDELQGHYHNIRYDTTGSWGNTINSVGGDNSGVEHLHEATPGGDAGYGEHDGNGFPRHGSETRSFNAGVLYCIKYKAVSGSVALAQTAYSELDTDASRGAATNADNSELPSYACRAFCTFDGTDFTTVNGESHCKILASGNISKVIRHETGKYSVHFKTPMPDINYSPTITGTGGGTSSGYAQLDTQQFNGNGSHDFWIDRFNIRATDSAGAYTNHPRISIQVFR